MPSKNQNPFLCWTFYRNWKKLDFFFRFPSPVCSGLKVWQWCFKKHVFVCCYILVVNKYLRYAVDRNATGTWSRWFKGLKQCIPWEETVENWIYFALLSERLLIYVSTLSEKRPVTSINSAASSRTSGRPLWSLAPVIECGVQFRL